MSQPTPTNCRSRLTRSPRGPAKSPAAFASAWPAKILPTLWIVAISIVVHGLSVTPVMRRYETWRERRTRRFAARS